METGLFFENQFIASDFVIIKNETDWYLIIVWGVYVLQYKNFWSRIHSFFSELSLIFDKLKTSL